MMTNATTSSELRASTQSVPFVVPKFNATRSSLGIMLTRLSLYPLTIITSIIVARLLGPSDRGIYAFLLLFGSTLLPLATFGAGAGVVYLLSSGQFDVNEVFVTTCLMGASLGAFCALLVGGCIQSNLMGSMIRAVPFSYVLPLLLLLPLQCVDFMLNRIALGTNWFALNNLALITKPLLNAVFVLVAVGVLKGGVHGAILAIVASGVVSLAGNMAMCVWRLSPKMRFRADFLRRCFSYGVRGWWGDLSNFVNLRLDQFVLGIVAKAWDLGLYSVAVNFTELLWVLPDSIAVVLFNRLAASARDAEERAALLARIHRVLFALTLLGGLCVGGFAFWVFKFTVGTKYLGSIGVLRILLPGTVLMISTKLVSNYFGGSGKPLKSSIPQVIGAAVSAVLYMMLIPRFGIVGAAAASSIGYAATAVLCLWIFVADSRTKLLKLFAIRMGDFGWVRSRLSGAMRQA